MAYWVTGSIEPFDDSQQVIKYLPRTTTNPAIDTRAFDGYRFGVELRNFGDIYNATQPKIWGGEFDQTGSVVHEQDITTYGQAVTFTSFFDSHLFIDNPKFNPVAYVALGNSYPLPIMFNDGPQAQQEAIIEPFTIPQRFNDVESLDVARTVRATVEDGNELDGRNKGTSIVEQFIELSSSMVVRPWLDEGELRYGSATYPSSAIIMPGYLSKAQKQLQPFIDQTNDYYNSYITALTNTTMSGAMMQLEFNSNNDIRPLNKKSAAAGHDVYGPSQARLGTDSIAFVGRIRGS